MFFGCVVISDLYLFLEIVILNSCFVFSGNLILSLIDKATTGTWSLALFNWNAVPVVCLVSLASRGGLALGLPAIAGVIDISDIKQ